MPGHLSDHWATSAASPPTFITWGKPLIRWGSMQLPGTSLLNPFVFASIWVCHEAIPTLLNFSPRSTKGKDATNKRFNSWRQPRPCGFALAAPLEQVAPEACHSCIASARTHLGDVAYELAWSKGAMMTTEQAITLRAKFSEFVSNSRT